MALASVMWKVADSEGSTYTIDTSASERVGAICFAVADAAIHAAAETNGDSGTATLPAIITTVADCLRISIVGADGTTQTTPHGTATNHTKLGEAWATSSGAVSAHYKSIPTATTDGDETSTLAASFRWIGFSIALAPAGGSVTLTPSAASAASSANVGATILGSLALTAAAASAAANALIGAIINHILLTPSPASAASGATVGLVEIAGPAQVVTLPQRRQPMSLAARADLTIKPRALSLTIGEP